MEGNKYVQLLTIERVIGCQEQKVSQVFQQKPQETTFNIFELCISNIAFSHKALLQHESFFFYYYNKKIQAL